MAQHQHHTPSSGTACHAEGHTGCQSTGIKPCTYTSLLRTKMRLEGHAESDHFQKPSFSPGGGPLRAFFREAETHWTTSAERRDTVHS